MSPRPRRPPQAHPPHVGPLVGPHVDPDLVARLRAAGCVFAEDEARLIAAAATDPVDLERLVAARAGGRPLEPLLGWAGFDGLRVVVEPGVFVPRQRTVLLVDLAERAARPGATVVDLCCGTGALGAALLGRRPDVVVHAGDLDPAAVANARRNLAPDHVHQGDLYEALPAGLRGGVDVLVVNAPYVPTDEITAMPPEARDHEHRIALDGGPDGLDVHRRVAAGATSWLAPGGTLLIEVAPSQVPAAVRLLERAPGPDRTGELVVDVVTDGDRGATAVRAVMVRRGRPDRGSG